MFRNFNKVFNFSFHNQAGTKSYRILTLVFALILLLGPGTIMLLIAHSSTKEEDELEPCGAERIALVSDMGAEVNNYLLLSRAEEKDYATIRYKTYPDLAAAEESVKEDEAAFILYFHPEDDYIRADILIPEASSVEKEDAENYFSFIERHGDDFRLLLTGLSEAKLMSLMPGNAYRTYTESGYAKDMTIDEDTQGSEELMRQQVKEVFGMLLPYLTIMILYFMILTYGNTVAQTMVMEKESKLMDTMLISLRPEAMVFGKLLAAIAAGLLQFAIWIVSIVVGLVAGMKLTEVFFPDFPSPLKAFFSQLNEMQIFTPLQVILGLCFLACGFIMYSSLAAIAGAISSTREEVASQNFLFVLPLVFSFMLVMMGGGLSSTGAPEWMLFVPFTASLLMPAEISLGLTELWKAGISFAILVALTLVIVIVAGRIYKMMALYKGNKVSIVQVIKSLGKESISS
ncbi:MAG: ABC transporter permease [Lachnospiraceae bacterium]|nr:ABC transporter permease [Lachnospiraceae bacterium]